MRIYFFFFHLDGSLKFDWHQEHYESAMTDFRLPPRTILEALIIDNGTCITLISDFFMSVTSRGTWLSHQYRKCFLWI